MAASTPGPADDHHDDRHLRGAVIVRAIHPVAASRDREGGLPHPPRTRPGQHRWHASGTQLARSWHASTVAAATRGSLAVRRRTVGPVTSQAVARPVVMLAGTKPPRRNKRNLLILREAGATPVTATGDRDRCPRQSPGHGTATALAPPVAWAAPPVASGRRAFRCDTADMVAATLRTWRRTWRRPHLRGIRRSANKTALLGLHRRCTLNRHRVPNRWSSCGRAHIPGTSTAHA